MVAIMPVETHASVAGSNPYARARTMFSNMNASPDWSNMNAYTGSVAVAFVPVFLSFCRITPGHSECGNTGTG
jgi:hypothetical protein